MAALAATGALAGGFHVREQSTLHQGASFAGNAAGGSLSTMFWNAAAAAFAPAGLSMDSNYAAIYGHTEITAGPGTTPGLLALNNRSGNIADPALLPASYSAYRLNDRAVLAIGINSPFGLVTEPTDPNWSGRNFARTSSIKTYNFNPTLGYRVTPTLAFGIGVQAQYIQAKLKQADALGRTIAVEGDDIGFGFTLGAMWTPHTGTSVGLGFRSAIEQKLEGDIVRVDTSATRGSINAEVTLPEILTLSLRQTVAPSWTLLGTVEWSNWSRLQRLDIVCSGAGGAFCPASGFTPNSIALGWHDGWLFSIGAEHAHSEKLTLRAGVGYEISPIQNPSERTPRVPDADRFWASFGGSYILSPATSLDFAYTHVFVEDSTINRIEGPLTLAGRVDSSVNIFSVGMRTKLGHDGPAPSPLK